MPHAGFELSGAEHLFYYAACLSMAGWWVIELTEYWFMAAILFALVHNAILLLILSFRSVRSLVSRWTHDTSAGSGGLLHALDRLAYRVAVRSISLLKATCAFCLSHAPQRRK